MNDFSLRSVPPFLDGLYLGVNAVPDAYLLIDCPSGCFLKCERIALNHDVTSDLFDPLGRHRVIQSGVTLSQLALGTEPELRRIVDRVRAEVAPRALFVTEVCAVAVTSNDLGAFCQRLAAELDAPVAHIPLGSLEGDYLDGFERFLEALVQSAPLPEVSSNSEEVALIGYFADRMENDHRANLAELDRLLGAVGVRTLGTLVGGGTMAHLHRAMAAPVLLEMPHAGAAASVLAARTGAARVKLDLPLGLGNTVTWLERVGEALGRQERVAALLEQELGTAVPEIDRARRRYLVDRNVVIAAEPALAAALVDFLAELGMNVPLVAVRARQETRLDPVRRAAARVGLESRMMHDLSGAALRRAIEELGGRDAADILIGSSMERDAARDLKLGFLELGYPSFATHALYPRPTLGFAGARRLVDDLISAVQLGDYERNSSRG